MNGVCVVVGAIVVGLGVLLICAVMGALPVMWLWNWLCPELFGLPEVGFCQAWGLLFLSSILFKSTRAGTRVDAESPESRSG